MKKSITFNKFFNLIIIISCILFFVCFFSLDDGEDTGIETALIILSIILMGIDLFAVPCFYTFDSEGVTIHHVFFPKERYLWENIHRIDSKTDNSSTNTLFFDLIFSGVFEIKGKVEGQKRFYMQGQISKSIRAKKLIQKYWDGEITKEFEFSSKKSKKQKRKHLSADEANEAERTARLKMRNWQTSMQKKTQKAMLEFRSNYIYTTKEYDEFKSRPNHAYTYIYEVEICKVGEKDENKIAYFSAELLYARPGKESWKCVENNTLDSDLESIEKEIESILDLGIDKYFE